MTADDDIPPDPVPAAVQATIEALSTMTVGRRGLPQGRRTLEPYQALFVQGDPGDAVHVVESGTVRPSVVTPSGLSRAVGDVRAGGFVGHGRSAA